MTLRATPASAGSSASATPRRYAGTTTRRTPRRTASMSNNGVAMPSSTSCGLLERAGFLGQRRASAPSSIVAAPAANARARDRSVEIDPDRQSRIVVGDDDQPMDVRRAPSDRPRPRSGVERSDRSRRGLRHQVADREARPVRPQVLGRPSADEVGLADDADERRQPSSTTGRPLMSYSSMSSAASVSGASSADDDRVVRHEIADRDRSIMGACDRRS